MLASGFFLQLLTLTLEQGGVIGVDLGKSRPGGAGILGHFGTVVGASQVRHIVGHVGAGQVESRVERLDGVRIPSECQLGLALGGEDLGIADPALDGASQVVECVRVIAQAGESHAGEVMIAGIAVALVGDLTERRRGVDVPAVIHQRVDGLELCLERLDPTGPRSGGDEATTTPGRSGRADHVGHRQLVFHQGNARHRRDWRSRRDPDWLGHRYRRWVVDRRQRDLVVGLG